MNILPNKKGGLNFVDSSVLNQYQSLPEWQKDSDTNPMLSQLNYKDNFYIPHLSSFSDVSRRFEKRVESTSTPNTYILEDSIADRDAKLLLPTSSFNGVDSSVDLGRPEILNFIPQVDAFEIEGWFKIPVGKNGIIYSLGSGLSSTVRQIVISISTTFELKLEIGGAFNSVTSFNNDGQSHLVKVVVPPSTIGAQIYIDNILQSGYSGNIGSYVGAENAYFGARTDGASFLLTGSLWGWKFYSGNGESRQLVLDVPLPHLGYGIDANGNGVELTPTNVGVEYNELGSDYLLNHGAVNKNPLIYESDFSDGKDVFVIRNSGTGATSTLTSDGDNLIINVIGIETDASRPLLSRTIDSDIKVGSILKITISNNSEVEAKLNYIAYQSTLTSTNRTISAHTSESVYITTIANPDAAYVNRLYLYFNGTIWNDGDTIKIGEIKVERITPNYIPNNLNEHPIFPIEEGDTLIPPTPKFLNSTPFGLTLFTSGQTDFEYVFFDKSDVTIWDDDVRNSNFYDSANTGNWDSKELTMEYIYEHCLLKYHLWIKLINDKYFDIFLRTTPLTDTSFDTNYINY